MKDRVVVITGARAGIGAALAVIVAERGAKPVLLARRAAELTEVARRSGPAAVAIPNDVTVRSQVESALTRTVSQLGGVDVWVNNAGRAISRPVSQLTDEDLDEMIAVNVKSALYGMQATLPHFRERRRGHLINVSSMLGRVPIAGFRSAYSTSKHALNALTTNFRMELAEEPDIHVSAVHPGVLATDFGLNALHGGPDSRALPFAQSAEEVVTVIADVIERPRADVYTRPEAQRMVVDYYAAADMAEAKAGFGGPPRKRA